MCTCKKSGNDDDPGPVVLIGGAIIIWVFVQLICQYVK